MFSSGYIKIRKIGKIVICYISLYFKIQAQVQDYILITSNEIENIGCSEDFDVQIVTHTADNAKGIYVFYDNRSQFGIGIHPASIIPAGENFRCEVIWTLD